MSRKKFLATDEAGFISVESSSPEKPVGTFIPALWTPRRSPRLAAKRKRCQAESLPQPSVYESAPTDPAGVPSSTLEAVRKVARSRQVVELPANRSHCLYVRWSIAIPSLGTWACRVCVRACRRFASRMSKNSNAPTVRKFFNFNHLCGRFALSIITIHYTLLVIPTLPVCNIASHVGGSVNLVDWSGP